MYERFKNSTVSGGRINDGANIPIGNELNELRQMNEKFLHSQMNSGRPLSGTGLDQHLNNR